MSTPTCRTRYRLLLVGALIFLSGFFSEGTQAQTIYWECTSALGDSYCKPVWRNKKPGCAGGEGYTQNNPTGECPEGKEPGKIGECVLKDSVLRSAFGDCENPVVCGGKSKSGGNKPGPENDGKTYATGMGDGKGIIQSSPVTSGCQPTQQAGGWKSEAYATIYEDRSDCWAAQLRIRSWSCTGVKEWYGHGAATEKPTIIMSICGGSCPGRGEWIKINPQISMDCVQGGNTPAGEEGVQPRVSSKACGNCSHANYPKGACTKRGSYSGCGVTDLQWSSSCQWEHHCRSCSINCGGKEIRCTEGTDAFGDCNNDKESCESATNSCWNSIFVKKCGEKYECYRKICAELEEDDIDGNDGTCEESTQYKVVFNRNTGCEKTLGPKDLGDEACDDRVNPAACPSYEYTAEFQVDDGSGSYQFFKRGPTGQCTVEWSRLDAPDGVNGLKATYGRAGRNGRWILASGEGEGWEGPDGECKFTCKRDDQGADCHSETLIGKLRFVPDLRYVIYRDNGFVSRMAPDSGPGKTHFENCSTAGAGSTENDRLSTGINMRGEVFNPRRSIEYQFDSPRQQIYQQINSKVYPVGVPAEPIVERMILGEGLFGSDHYFDAIINNQYNYTTDQGYWACACLAVNPNASNIASEDDCRLMFTPSKASDICTTKRLYLGLRSCFNSPWWQVSGGNVYASENIVDDVPTGLNSDPQCNPEGDIDCEDVSENYLPKGHQNDFPDLPLEKSKNISGDKSCTPRIIRGRTPCKNDGPSNSAGIALTQYGTVQAAETTDYYYQRAGAQAKIDLLKRVTERSNIHALYQGIYNPLNNINNPAGLQSKIVNSRVLPNKNGDFGYRPPREDYRYFVALAGGFEKLQSIAPGNNQASTTNFANLKSRCAPPTTTDDQVTYLCYLEGDLEINSDRPWVIQNVNGKKQNYTIFLDGNLTLSGNEHDDNAVTSVDIGNFLAFIVSGDINIEPTVGIRMPDPKAPGVDLRRCWEGQSATLPADILNQYPRYNQAQADYTSAIGAVEGIFIADGNITIGNYATFPAAADYCLVDKRFIGQGSFISWKTVKLLRNFTPRNAGCQGDVYGVYNKRVPAETFIYRPDLIRNTPAWMKRSTTHYMEVTGGFTR